MRNARLAAVAVVGLMASSELAAQAPPAGDGTVADCKVCPRGACVQGSVIDPAGVPEAATVWVAAVADRPPVVTTARRDGTFFLVGIVEGRAELKIGAVGFQTLKAGPIEFKRGMTYVFDRPLMLPVGAMSEEWTTTELPRECTGGTPPVNN